jgi:hypothetical protein
MERSLALKIVELSGRYADDLVDVLREAKNSLPDDAYQKLKRGVAKAMNTIDIHVVEIAVAEYPDLDPWKDHEDQASGSSNA